MAVPSPRAGPGPRLGCAYAYGLCYDLGSRPGRRLYCRLYSTGFPPEKN